MEQLRHTNDIEIKLLPNRRFIYANRKQNIVITAEHHATEITVQFPDEYEDYSKRVDFVNSKGKEWTEALYIPEYKEYEGGFNKSRFHFTLPTEVTTTGELKMQFLAYNPDDMTTVPFEVIPIDILDGVLAFKKNARSNPDLLILSYNQSTEALFNSQRAVTKSENAVEIATQAERQSAEAVDTANRTEANLNAEIERAMQAESDLQTALDTESQRATDAEQDLQSQLTAEVERSMTAEQRIADDLAEEARIREEADDENAQAIAEEAVRAIGVEAQLASTITAETDRALAFEALLSGAIADEKTRAETAEQDLQTQHDAEVLRAKNRENQIAQDLTNEADRAKLAEQINATAIADEAMRATTAEQALSARVTAETARLDEVDSKLAADLSGEVARSTAREAALQQAIDSERTRALTAEGLLSDALTAEVSRATAAENALGARLDSEVPQALAEAKQYANQVAEQVRIDGTKYIGTLDESDLPMSGNENGDLYWISDFDLTQPDHSGSAIWNGATNKWDFNIDRYKHQDDETIVARASDGALKIADTEEINLTPDMTDFGGSVTMGDKAVKRSVIRKVRGLFQRTGENTSAITAEATRAQTVESTLSAEIATEVTRAKVAEQINANNIAAETSRATTAENNLSTRIIAEESRAQTAESGLSSRITAEESRAKTAEQSNTTAITAEVQRALTAESGLAVSVLAEEARAKAAEAALNTTIAAEETRALLAEQALQQSILDNAKQTQADWQQTDIQSVQYIHNKPSAMPASDVQPWAKALNKPSYTPSEVGAEPQFSKNTAFNKNFGSGAGTVCQGNDSRLSDARTPTAHTHTKSQITDFPTSMPASDVSAWAKAASKPTYTANEVGAEPAFNKNTAFNKNFGTASGTVCDGADSRLSNARPASDVSAWAKAASKPTYTASEVGAEPAFTKNNAFNKNFGTASGTVCQGNDSRLSNARPPTAHTHGNADLVEIAAWAKAASKPSYTASEVGAEPAFSKNTAFNKNFGTTSGTVCDGADSRLSNARTPTSHASTGTTYGIGSNANYGHNKLSMPALTVGEATSLTTLGSTFGQYSRAVTHMGTQSSINLNDFTSEGAFLFYNVNTTRTNFPSTMDGINTSNHTFRLEVRNIGYGSTSTLNIHQTLYARGATDTAFCEEWTRQANNGTWSPWHRAVTESMMTSAISNALNPINGVLAINGNVPLSGTPSLTKAGRIVTLRATINLGAFSQSTYSRSFTVGTLPENFRPLTAIYGANAGSVEATIIASQSQVQTGVPNNYTTNMTFLMERFTVDAVLPNGYIHLRTLIQPLPLNVYISAATGIGGGANQIRDISNYRVNMGTGILTITFIT